MLGLAQEIGGDEARVGAVVRQHHQFAGPRRKIDRGSAGPRGYIGFGGRDIGIAGPEDLIDTRDRAGAEGERGDRLRSEEQTSELQSLMRISYAVFCLKK